MDAPTLQALTTVAGATVLTAVIVQLILPLFSFAPATQDRVGPLIAVAIGILVVLVATFTVVSGVGKADVVQGVVNGIFAGLAAIGVHNVVTKSVV